MGVREFQAVVMAGGKGSRMTELTARRVKCLLPVGNHPMIWYPLQMLETYGFGDVIVVVLESVKTEIQSALERTGLKLNIEVVGIPSGEDWGTADALRFLQDSSRIKSDVVVVSCDLITDVDISGVLDVFRRHDAAISALFFHTDNTSSTLPTPGPKSKDKTERDIVGVDPATSRLVFLASASDYEETMELSTVLLRKHGRIRLYSKLLDAHFYVIKQWLCQFLSHNRNFTTLKGELLPYVVKKQLSKPLSVKAEHDKTTSVVDVNTKTDILEFAEESKLALKVRKMSNYTDHSGDQMGAYHDDTIRCYAYIAPETNFATRANTLQEYCRINRQVIERWETLTKGKDLIKFSPNCVVSSSQVDRETCVIADKANISEKTSIKSTIIGPQVSVKPKTRISNCIIMSGVKVGEGCVLNNCVLCDEADIGDNCELKDCIVGSLHFVQSGGHHANEVLTDVAHLIEI